MNVFPYAANLYINDNLVCNRNTFSNPEGFVSKYLYKQPYYKSTFVFAYDIYYNS